jgi:hypothetical protein
MNHTRSGAERSDGGVGGSSARGYTVVDNSATQAATRSGSRTSGRLPLQRAPIASKVLRDIVDHRSEYATHLPPASHIGTYACC